VARKIVNRYAKLALTVASAPPELIKTVCLVAFRKEAVVFLPPTETATFIASSVMYSFEDWGNTTT